MSHNVKEETYNYECDIDRNIYSPFQANIPIIDIIKNNEGKKFIEKYMPKVYEIINNKDVKILQYNIKSANKMLNLNYSSDIIKKCNEELYKIKP